MCSHKYGRQVASPSPPKHLIVGMLELLRAFQGLLHCVGSWGARARYLRRASMEPAFASEGSFRCIWHGWVNSSNDP